jgi:hypothetical protein
MGLAISKASRLEGLYTIVCQMSRADPIHTMENGYGIIWIFVTNIIFTNQQSKFFQILSKNYAKRTKMINIKNKQQMILIYYMK